MPVLGGFDVRYLGGNSNALQERLNFYRYLHSLIVLDNKDLERDGGQKGY